MRKRSPGRVLKLIFKLHTYIYRSNLSWLFGHRLLMVTHRGRKAGRIRYTVLEVIRYDRVSKEAIVGAGWGAGSDWYRNLQAHPALEVRIASQQYTPEQRFLTLHEAERELADYIRRHPVSGRLMPRVLLRVPYDGSESQRRALAARIPMMGFRFRSSGES